MHKRFAQKLQYQAILVNHVELFMDQQELVQKYLVTYVVIVKLVMVQREFVQKLQHIDVMYVEQQVDQELVQSKHHIHIIQ